MRAYFWNELVSPTFFALRSSVGDRKRRWYSGIAQGITTLLRGTPFHLSKGHTYIPSDLIAQVQALSLCRRSCTEIVPLHRACLYVFAL